MCPGSRAGGIRGGLVIGRRVCPWDTPPAAKVSGTDPSPASGQEEQLCLTGEAALSLSSSFVCSRIAKAVVSR